jgi:hypothetical protein
MMSITKIYDAYTLSTVSTFSIILQACVLCSDTICQDNAFANHILQIELQPDSAIQN